MKLLIAVGLATLALLVLWLYVTHGVVRPRLVDPRSFFEATGSVDRTVSLQ